jgi:CheY-like chemotaxis protein
MPSILIIDDEEGNRETLGVYSEMLGYEPILAEDYSSCSTILAKIQACAEEQSCADVLLINQNLATMTGLEFVEKQILKGCKAATYSKAIMSGALTQEEFKLAKKLGCHVLQKPVTYEILENWLSSVDAKNQKRVEAN